MDPDEYRKLAEVEDRMWYFRVINARATEALRRAHRGPPGVGLDAGCGTGGWLKVATARTPGWTWQGLDFSAQACALARARTGCAITEGSITALPFADASFAAVVTLDVICQVEDARRAFAELARCTVPGGVGIVNVPALMSLWSYHDETCQTRHRYTRREIAAHAAATGWRVEQLTYTNFLALPLIAARRKLLPPADPTSDVRLYPAPVEALFRGMGGAESWWLRRGGRLPIGSSVFAVLRRLPA
jgi:ubiquinone/menaquinone biosynthesis C-methylase UbiE